MIFLLMKGNGFNFYTNEIIVLKILPMFVANHIQFRLSAQNSKFARDHPEIMSSFENGLKHLWMTCKKPDIFEVHNDKYHTGYYYFPYCFPGEHGTKNKDKCYQWDVEQPDVSA